MVNIICALIAYLLGSIETSVILSKLFKFPDPRTHGSGNSGATNVLRTAGKNQALLTLIGDMLKGFLAVLIALVFGVKGFFLAFTLLAAVIGHVFPPRRPVRPGMDPPRRRSGGGRGRMRRRRGPGSAGSRGVGSRHLGEGRVLVLGSSNAGRPRAVPGMPHRRVGGAGVSVACPSATA